jgi:hypothetical protein
MNQVSKGRMASGAIKRLTPRALAARESECVAAVKLVENNPAFVEALDISDWIDAQAVDLLSRR